MCILALLWYCPDILLSFVPTGIIVRLSKAGDKRLANGSFCCGQVFRLTLLAFLFDGWSNRPKRLLDDEIFPFKFHKTLNVFIGFSFFDAVTPI
jgi:hypothetical protein